MAGSKFNFTQLSGGACHLISLMWRFGWAHQAWLCSLKDLSICLNSSVGLLLRPSTLALFLVIQIWSQRIKANSWNWLTSSTFKPKEDFGFKTILIQSWIEMLPILQRFKAMEQEAKFGTPLHWIKRCSKDLRAFWHKKQSRDWIGNLLFIAIQVGKIPQASFHNRFFSLAWTLSFQIASQSLLVSYWWW